LHHHVNFGELLALSVSLGIDSVISGVNSRSFYLLAWLRVLVLVVGSVSFHKPVLALLIAAPFSSLLVSDLREGQ